MSKEKVSNKTVATPAQQKPLEQRSDAELGLMLDEQHNLLLTVQSNINTLKQLLLKRRTNDIDKPE